MPASARALLGTAARALGRRLVAGAVAAQARGGHPRLDLRQNRLRGHGSGGGRVNAGHATQWATRSGRCAICNPPFCSRMELVNVHARKKKVRRGMHAQRVALARFSQGRTRILAPLPHAAAPSLPAPHGVAAFCLACLAYGIAFKASSDVARVGGRKPEGASSGELGRERRSPCATRALSSVGSGWRRRHAVPQSLGCCCC